MSLWSGLYYLSVLKPIHSSTLNLKNPYVKVFYVFFFFPTKKLTQFWHYTPRECRLSQFKGSVPEDCSHSDSNRESRLSPILMTEWLQIGGSGPIAPSSGVINLLEQLAELRELFTYIYQFIINGTIKNTDEWPDDTPLSPAPHVHSPRSFQTPFCVCVCVLWRLHYTAMIDHIIDHSWLIEPLEPFSSLKIRGVGMKVPTH